MPLAHLSDRSVVKVAGPEARSFLDRLVTCDLDRLAPGGARYGALLTPQGKMVADFILFDGAAIEAQSYFLDLPAAVAPEFVKRLATYRLRAKLTVTDVSEDYRILVGWGEVSPPTGEKHLVAPDPRLVDLGWRAVVGRHGLMDAGSPEDQEGAYHAHRIALGVPEGGRDFAFNDAFPHEAVMDGLGGVDFDKGCYVGQEVVSRMQHRGTARTRVVSLAYEEGRAAEPGQEVAAGERALGQTGSAAGGTGLATIRLDRAAEALAAGEKITAGGHPVRFAKPGWVRFAYPGEGPAPAA